MEEKDYRSRGAFFLLFLLVLLLIIVILFGPKSSFKAFAVLGDEGGGVSSGGLSEVDSGSGDGGPGTPGGGDLGSGGTTPPKKYDWSRSSDKDFGIRVEEPKTCESLWRCDDFGECREGIKYRECTDINECDEQTNAPLLRRSCEIECVESWRCSWSSCEDGYITPRCIDLNKCGTANEIPKRIECGAEEVRECVPDVECGLWSSCDVDYGLLDLNSNEIKELKGFKRRTCRDINSCVETLREVAPCSVEVEVYVEEFEKCDMDYVGVYNELDDKLLARIKLAYPKDLEKKVPLSIYLDEPEEEIYCDYCSNGILDGDEVYIDCGGSCKSCEDKYNSQELINTRAAFTNNFINSLKI